MMPTAMTRHPSPPMSRTSESLAKSANAEPSPPPTRGHADPLPRYLPIVAVSGSRTRNYPRENQLWAPGHSRKRGRNHAVEAAARPRCGAAEVPEVWEEVWEEVWAESQGSFLRSRSSLQRPQTTISPSAHRGCLKTLAPYFGAASRHWHRTSVLRTHRTSGTVLRGTSGTVLRYFASLRYGRAR
jgi:hypothetical protein